MINVVLDTHCIKVGRNYYCKEVYCYTFWKPYISVFEQVKLHMRVMSLDVPPSGYFIVNGVGVEIIEYPELKLHDFREILKMILRINKKQMSGYILFRSPSFLGDIILLSGLIRRNEIIHEVMADPYDAIASKKGWAFNILAVVYKVYYRRLLKSSKYVSYVTARTLQNQYPSNVKAKSVSYSSIRDFPERSDMNIELNNDKIHILSVGSMARNLYKGQDIAIDCLSALELEGINFELHVIGSGPSNEFLKDLASSKSYGHKIKFYGSLTRSQVRWFMECADLLLLPSRQEGLPRTIIEAAKVGLPTVANRVGGVEELIDNEFLYNHARLTSQLFGKLVVKLLKKPDLLFKESARLKKVALNYDSNTLMKRRLSFYEEICKK